ncbi:MAG: hypothetical protein JST26_01530 [Bacteroidetes bacterium]|nr:hypothetical protein [Bacteroidota bacterium]
MISLKKTVYILLMMSSFCFAQKPKLKHLKQPLPLLVQWCDSLAGDFTFTRQWSYPWGVEMKKNGHAGCADGGFCPERCYRMMDDQGIVLKDSTEIFYRLLDTTHLFHTLECEAKMSEWDGSDFMHVYRSTPTSVYAYSETSISTHCSLQLRFEHDTCYASVDLNSIMPEGSAVYYCLKGFVQLDRIYWAKGMMKARFEFYFKEPGSSKELLYWKGRIMAPIMLK